MPPHFFLRTEQFNPKLELFLAIHQRMEVAFNYRVFNYCGPYYVPPINFPILFMINSQHGSQHSSRPMHSLFLPLHFSCAVSALAYHQQVDRFGEEVGKCGVGGSIEHGRTSSFGYTQQDTGQDEYPGKRNCSHKARKNVYNELL